MRIIVCGLIAQYPLGGVAWDYLQYVLGLKELGHDVYYFEDTGQWPFNPVEGGIYSGCEWNARYLGEVMTRFGLGEKWAYRVPWQNQWFGIDDDGRNDAIEGADLLLNISGCLFDPSDYRAVKTLAFIDSDPVFTQVKILNGDRDLAESLREHHYLFTFGERIANRTANLIDTGIEWLPTRQPIVLNEWQVLPEAHGYTTVMNWTSYQDFEFWGRKFGHKDQEFLRFLQLPRAVPEVSFEIAMSIGKTRRVPAEKLSEEGWTILNPNDVCADLDSYREFIGSSRAEWSVAKHGYVEGRSGWFSCRSACYLAAGKPVIVQSTGFEDFIPTGKGLLSFSDMEEAIGALRAVESDYEGHSTAARELAVSHFDSRTVLENMLDAMA